MVTILGLVLSVAVLIVIYAVVIGALKGGMTVLNSKKAKVEPRVIKRPEQLDHVEQILKTNGWQIIGTPSTNGDANYRKGVLTVAASRTHEGSVLAFLGVMCARESVAELDRHLDALVA